MNTAIKKICILTSALLFLAGAPALAQNAGVTNLEENYHNSLFTDPAKYNDTQFSAGPDEKLFYKATDWKGVFLQAKYEGITDAYKEDLIHSLAPAPYNTANPGGWMVAVHYPQNTGNKDVDAALAKYAQTCFNRWLPAGAETYAKLDPAAWPAKEQFDKGDVKFDSQSLLKQLSFATKRLLQLNGDAYQYPGKDEKPVLPYITTYQISRPGKNYLSVIFTSWYFEGGAHDMWEAHVLNYDLTTGKEITLAELFKGNPAQDNVRKFLTALDKKRRGDDGIKAFGSAGKPELDMHRIAMTPEGLVVIFNPYEIGSFAEGSLLYTVPQKEFKKLGIEGKFWKN